MFQKKETEKRGRKDRESRGRKRKRFKQRQENKSKQTDNQKKNKRRRILADFGVISKRFPASPACG